jgi:hypothetical protein
MSAQAMRPSSAQVVASSAIRPANQYTPWSTSGRAAVTPRAFASQLRGAPPSGLTCGGSRPSVV